MIYLLVALESEVEGLQLPDGMALVFTGVGKINAAYQATCTALLPDCAQIINYGTAGTLDAAFAGQFVPVARILQRDIDGRPLVERGITPFETGAYAGALIVGDAGVTLSTGDNFVTQPPAIASDIVDMEGYAIAKVCLRQNIPFHCVKYVTDLADENATANWRENVSLGVGALQAFVDQLASGTNGTSVV